MDKCIMGEEKGMCKVRQEINCRPKSRTSYVLCPPSQCHFVPAMVWNLKSQVQQSGMHWPHKLWRKKPQKTKSQ